MNTVAEQFRHDPSGFLPLFDTASYENEEEKDAAIEDWTLGFIMGMELTYEAWEPLLNNEETALLVFPMFMLSKVAEGSENMTQKELRDLVLAIPGSVISIYFFWKNG